MEPSIREKVRYFLPFSLFHSHNQKTSPTSIVDRIQNSMARVHYNLFYSSIFEHHYTPTIFWMQNIAKYFLMSFGCIACKFKGIYMTQMDRFACQKFKPIN